MKKRVTGKKRRKELTQAQYLRNAGMFMFGSVNNTPLPTKLKATFRYFDAPSMNIGLAGAPATHVYSANGCYDPDITGAGGQPRGFDELMALYDHFVVIGSKCTVMYAANAASAPTLLMLDLKDTQTADANQRATMESSFSSYILHSPAGPTSCLVQTFSPKFLGKSKYLSDPDLKGSASANPDESAYYHVVMSSPSGTDEGVAYPTVVLEYTVMLIEPKRPSAS